MNEEIIDSIYDWIITAYDFLRHAKKPRLPTHQRLTPVKSFSNSVL